MSIGSATTFRESFFEKVSDLKNHLESLMLFGSQSWDNKTVDKVRSVYFALQPHLLVMKSDQQGVELSLAAWNRFLRGYSSGTRNMEGMLQDLEILKSSCCKTEDSFRKECVMGGDEEMTSSEDEDSPMITHRVASSNLLKNFGVG
jgi:hypothetical protein